MKLEVFILGGQRLDQKRRNDGEARGIVEREKWSRERIEIERIEIERNEKETKGS